MKKTTVSYCKSCKYSLNISNGMGVMCDYLGITGQRRGCEVGFCDKYEPKNNKPKVRPLRVSSRKGMIVR